MGLFKPLYPNATSQARADGMLRALVARVLELGWTPKGLMKWLRGRLDRYEDRILWNWCGYVTKCIQNLVGMETRPTVVNVLAMSGIETGQRGCGVSAAAALGALLRSIPKPERSEPMCEVESPNQTTEARDADRKAQEIFGDVLYGNRIGEAREAAQGGSVSYLPWLAKHHGVDVSRLIAIFKAEAERRQIDPERTLRRWQPSRRTSIVGSPEDRPTGRKHDVGPIYHEDSGRSPT